MKETGILFKPEMVKAILDNRKTQTRRLVEGLDTNNPVLTAADGSPLNGSCWDIGKDIIHCPYGKRGDRLWVREAWRMPLSYDRYNGTETAENCLEAGYKKPWAPIRYEVDGARDNWQAVTDRDDNPGRYRHARFMPRWASRITLEITDVRVQRLLEISERDCYEEGVRTVPSDQRAAFVPGTDFVATGGTAEGRYIGCYSLLWDSINFKKAPWNSNPFVWAITFKRVHP